MIQRVLALFIERKLTTNQRICRSGNDSFGSLCKYESGNRARQEIIQSPRTPRSVRGAYV